MTHRQNISSGTVWEGSVGYSRAVRIGNLIEVAGTTALDDQGNVVGHQDVYEQTKYILSKIEKALKIDSKTLSSHLRPNNKGYK